MKRTPFFILLLATFNAGFFPCLAAYAQPTTMLYVDPSDVVDPTKVVGTTLTFDVTVKDVTDLYTFNFMLNYSKTILTATEISIGSFFPLDSFIWKQELNDAQGYVRYMVGLPLGTPKGHGLSGSGALATITFVVRSFGESTLYLCKTELVDSYAQLIAHQSQNGHFANELALAAIDICPETLNLRSKGQWITAYIHLPVGSDAADIRATTVLLNGTISPILDPKYGFVTNSGKYLLDHNNDGILKRMVKFDREAVESFITNHGISYGNATITITGKLHDGTQFEGTDIIFVSYDGPRGRR